MVVGAAGQLGSELLRRLGNAAAPLTRADLDLADLDRIEPAVARLAPRVVVNCAAYNDVDRAEAEPEAARVVNALAVERLAAAARRAGAGFVTFSSDYVFDGAASGPYVESSPPRPLNRYGESKLEGERRALAAHPGALVVRTSWVLSRQPPNFAATMLRLSAAGRLRVVDDQVASPTLAADLAPAVLAAIDAGATGLLHLANQGELSRFELAREVVALAGRDPELVAPISTAEFGAAADRPRYATLRSERLERWGLAPMPHYRPALAEAVAALVEAGL